MNEANLVLGEILSKAKAAHARYGRVQSTHEAIGVVTEEFWELVEAIRTNELHDVAKEATDIAAICYRLAVACYDGSIKERSVK